jgi:3-oxoadipate enol-lactonase
MDRLTTGDGHAMHVLAAPFLVIVGDRDVPDIQAIVKTLEVKIPRAKKVIVRGAGHMVNMEKPEEFNAAVLEFLKQIRSQSR